MTLLKRGYAIYLSTKINFVILSVHPYTVSLGSLPVAQYTVSLGSLPEAQYTVSLGSLPEAQYNRPVLQAAVYPMGERCGNIILKTDTTVFVFFMK